jgi:Protein of unknown function (DUF2845)
VHAIAALALCVPVHAETLRCGSSLIQEGMSQSYVVEKCGAPDSKMESTEPVYARRPDGFTYKVGEATQEIWRYKRGSGQFPAVMTFQDGKLKKLEFEK